SKRFPEHIRIVEEMLDELEADGKKVLKVFNKIDQLSPREITDLKKRYPEAIFISAERGIGLNALKEGCKQLIERDYVSKRAQIPVSKYEAVAFLHRVANIDSKEYVNSHVDMSF